MRRIRVFLDSSVIIAGIAWAAGGSHEVLALAELGVIAPCLSEEVVAEVLGNVQKKLPGCLGSYYALFKALSFRVIDASPEDLEHARSMINEKDAPILAAAISGRVDWLGGFIERGEGLISCANSRVPSRKRKRPGSGRRWLCFPPASIWPGAAG